jgi:AraC-like DNA-binding protein
MSKPNTILYYLSAIDADASAAFVVNEKLEADFAFHQHRKGQLTYIEGGMSYLYTSDKTYFLPARHWIWIPAGMEHFVYFNEQAPMALNLYFGVSGEQDAFYNRMGIYPVHPLLLELFAYILPWQGEVATTEASFTILQTIRYLLAKLGQQPLPIVLPTSRNETMQRILAYMHQEAGETLTLHGVARYAGLSVRSLSRLFRQELGLSFLQYLRQYRIIKSMEALLEGKRSIGEIAFDSGYKSIAAFSNAFYDMVKVRPTAFRGE